MVAFGHFELVRRVGCWATRGVGPAGRSRRTAAALGRVGGLAALLFAGTAPAFGSPVATTATVRRVRLRRECGTRVVLWGGAAEQVELAQTHAGWHEQRSSDQERDERPEHVFDDRRITRTSDTIN
jgi:hypothetical protein